MNRIPQWYYRQSGVIPFREKDGEIEILLITSRRGKRWIIPKGIVEQNMSPADSAQKEALEEAGVEGVLSERPFGEYEYPKWDGICTVLVYLMRITKIHQDWPEKKVRKRRWMGIDEAGKLVREEKLKQLLRQMPALIGNF